MLAAPRGQKLCYFRHQRSQQLSRIHRHAETLHLAPLETLQDVQVALFEVIHALVTNTIDHKRARALLFALQQASLLYREPSAA